MVPRMPEIQAYGVNAKRHDAAPSADWAAISWRDRGEQARGQGEPPDQRCLEPAVPAAASCSTNALATASEDAGFCPVTRLPSDTA